jgi:hypothetical protein
MAARMDATAEGEITVPAVLRRARPGPALFLARMQLASEGEVEGHDKWPR